MKFAVVDDEAEYAAMIAALLLNAGHEVLAIGVMAQKPTQIKRDLSIVSIFSNDPDFVAETVRNFAPDMVFMDHHLDEDDRFTGATIAGHARLQSAQVVGTSSSKEQLLYCGQQMPISKHLLGVSRDPRHQQAMETFIQGLAASLA